MVDQVIGLLLLGLGINKGMVLGDQTTAVTATSVGIRPGEDRKNVFHINTANFQRTIKTATGAGNKRTEFDKRAFGEAVLRVQEDFTNRLEASREAAKKEFEDHKKEFELELAHIKDTKKQAIVDRINTNCQDINVKRTTAMTGMLAKLSSILTNVTNRAATASASGKDTSAVDTAVTTAQAAIADAQSAVAAQAGKTCTITITSDTTVKADVGKTISGIEADLKSVYAKVIAARKSVGDAVKSLALALGESL